MDSRYDHALFENQIYSTWEAADAFNPDAQPARDKRRLHTNSKSTTNGSSLPFSVVMPPPNANDSLHIGHAMFVTIEDVLVRFHRMMGHDTIWLPGTDHAGIETQFVFEKKLQKKGQSRFNFDRKTLYSMIWDYVQENSDVAVNQIKRLGASADWSRFTFTLDKTAVAQALQTFSKLHDDNLIYRDLQLVNYCTKCGTSYSELEVLHVERQGALYYIKYPHADDPTKFELVATTRPETMLVDTHLAIHPDNPKTKHLLNKTLINPLTDQPMSVIADGFVDPEFGTGIVKLTPAHDFNDHAAAKTYNQNHEDQIQVVTAISTTGKILDSFGEFSGLNVEAARSLAVKNLEAKQLIDHDRTNLAYQQTVGTCYRCGRVLEPLALPQFFIKVNHPQNSLTQAALKTLETGQTKIHGAGYDKILTHWLKNLKDWNISRQIVWGIRIPIWYDVTKTEIQERTSVTYLDQDQKMCSGKLSEILAGNSEKLAQVVAGLQTARVEVADAPYVISDEQPSQPGLWLPETDTFDTWFSSSQWPVTTLKANRLGNSSDFNRFYPTSVMETAYDILVFWVMRMMLMGTYLTGVTPFKDVYLHGLVRDEKGQKMSKSKGNVINPLEIVDEFGADSLRVALCIRSTAGIDKSVSRPDFKAARNLTNKLWNAARFIILKHQEAQNSSNDTIAPNQEFDRRLNQVITDTTQQLTDLRVGLAMDTVYNEFWHWFCDECIEAHKKSELSLAQLTHGLIMFLKLLHPFAPFITEALWQELKKANLVQEPLLISAVWPE